MSSFVATLAVLVVAFLIGVKFAVDLVKQRPRKASCDSHLTPTRIGHSTPTHTGHNVVSSSMSYCEVRCLHITPPVPCGHSAKAKCSNCETLLCSAHTERCELCGRTFCKFCLAFHQSEHSKEPRAVRAATQNKKSA